MLYREIGTFPVPTPQRGRPSGPRGVACGVSVAVGDVSTATSVGVLVGAGVAVAASLGGVSVAVGDVSTATSVGVLVGTDVTVAAFSGEATVAVGDPFLAASVGVLVPAAGAALTLLSVGMRVGTSGSDTGLLVVPVRRSSVEGRSTPGQESKMSRAPATTSSSPIHSGHFFLGTAPPRHCHHDEADHQQP